MIRAAVGTTPSAALLYCRAGFEKECAAEIVEHADRLGVAGYAKAKPDSGYVVFTPHDAADAARLLGALRWQNLIFARQLVFVAALAKDLPTDDRVTPLLAVARTLGTRFSAVLAETADTNEAKELLGFCRKFSAPFTRALRAAGLYDEEEAKAPRLHLFFLNSSAAYVGLAFPAASSPWIMGIPRLRMPHAAPSRSTLKLAEAFMTLLSQRERETRLTPGMHAVDLGAAPGGWTWQMVSRSIHVTAVDNGPLDAALLDSGLVDHRRVDGFTFRPKKPVDWLVCDMAEQPARVAALVADWLAKDQCRDCIFNLKLPMKKRYEEVQRCVAIIDDRLGDAGVRYRLRLKQLYHDREEVTGYLCKV